ncbi:MAG: DNA-processing protein DprA [Glaciimonas sp.]|nr:DNA-processing protein DprA [Glaciimonas sp.]
MVSATKPPNQPETTPADWVAWLRLEQTPGIGSEFGRRLLAAFGLPENIFVSSYSSLIKVVPEKIVLALLAPPSDDLTALIERTLTWLQQPDNHVLTLADSAYPKALLDISDPPLMLYAKGRIELLARPSLAVVGSRNATGGGILNADQFSLLLSQRGLTIISGMALGIDAAAHQGALKGAENNVDAGSTVAVIGTGADIVYPARNRPLAHQIADVGCIVSEYPLGMPGIAANFPRRNRIISGLARGVLVVEAAAQSGSLITARMAAEQGRDVFAIPGSIHATLSKGCHQLIKQGAKLVESAQDILEELGQYPLDVALGVASARAPKPTKLRQLPEREVIEPAGSMNIAPVTGDETDSNKAHVLGTLGYDPVGLDLLAERSGLPVAILNAQLLTLELDGMVEMLPGGVYQRIN